MTQPPDSSRSPAAALMPALAASVAVRLSRLAILLLALAAVHELTGTIRVVDGDTVDRWFLRFRLAGFDAPEIRKAKCPEERAAGRAAAQRLRELLSAASSVRLAPTQWRLDTWGRVVARLEVDGRDVATLMIAEGHARPYDGRSKRAGWCAGAAVAAPE